MPKKKHDSAYNCLSRKQFREGSSSPSCLTQTFDYSCVEYWSWEAFRLNSNGCVATRLAFPFQSGAPPNLHINLFLCFWRLYFSYSKSVFLSALNIAGTRPLYRTQNGSLAFAFQSGAPQSTRICLQNPITEPSQMFSQRKTLAAANTTLGASANIRLRLRQNNWKT